MLLSPRTCTPCTLEAPRRGGAGQSRERFHAPLERADLAPEVLVLGRQPAAGRPPEVGIVPPPVEPDLLRLVDRADDEADADGEQLHLGQGDPDVARDQQPLVEDAIEHVDQAGRGAMLVERKDRSHSGPPESRQWSSQESGRRRRYTSTTNR